MTLRTPRRRISPRTKRRYRAIREFFRRAIGSSSQPDIKISSSIAFNVTDLKRKIVGLEEQLDQVSRHCQDVVHLQNDSSKVSESISQTEVTRDTRTVKDSREISTDRLSNEVETRVLYKTSDCNCRKSDDSDYEQKRESRTVDQHDKLNYECCEPNKKVIKEKKLEKINEYNAKLHKHKTHSAYENFSTAYSTSSFHSLANPRNAHSHADYSGRNYERKHYKAHYRSISPNQIKDKKRKEYMDSNNMENYFRVHEDRPTKSRNYKRVNRELDQDFIADIIRRQYKPVKMFGKKESDISQFSAPVCRDQEYSIHDNIQEGSELCSCVFEGKKRVRERSNDLSDMRSVCDARLYSSKRHLRPSHRRIVDVYNNSELYDLVPVKEKASPKSRRKFVEDNLTPYGYHREVPPSPRTLRPRLNLKSQYYTEFQDYMAHVKPSRRCSPNRPKRHQECLESFESDITADMIQERRARHMRRAQKQAKMQEQKVQQQEQMQDTGTMSSLQYPAYVNEQIHKMVDTSLNKTQETDLSVDKTDKALCEIKDILQSFLHEIKKETTSQCDKSDSTSKSGVNNVSMVQQNSTKTQGSVLPNSGHSFNNFGLGQCIHPYTIPAPFANPCCYPIVCPMNCMQNGFVMPTPSFTCTNCAASPNESSRGDNQCPQTKNTPKETFNTETEELIKEIYKFVAQVPKKKSECDNRCKKKEFDTKLLTSRSVGESYKASKHDAKVGTPKTKYSSKSCEAIGSNDISDTYYSTNQSYSDTLLDRLSLEVTQSDSDVSTESTEVEKGKQNKFSKVLRSFSLFKKKKKDVIEELSESESVIDVEVKPKPKPPYHQEMTNYMMYGQDYYNRPPDPRDQYQQPTEYHPDFHPPYNTGVNEYPRPPPQNPYPNKQQPMPAQYRNYPSPHRPTAPPYSPYDNRYNQPQVPLCLKEIEVKSIGTQSERKMSIFRKIKKVIQPPVQLAANDPQRNFGTQTAVDSKPAWFKGAQAGVDNKPAWFKGAAQAGVDNKPAWFKNLQAKAMQDKMDPIKFSMKTQKELAEGDNKMRNAMLKKMFYKRNPFSPRNLIVRTLLGKDKSSYGDPPMMFRPKLFF